MGKINARKFQHINAKLRNNIFLTRLMSSAQISHLFLEIDLRILKLQIIYSTSL